MKKKTLFISVISTTILVLVSIAPSINANVDELIEENSQEEDITPTPIVLVLQLMTKLRNHKDIESIESEEDVLQIIESDEELNSIVERLSGDDCGCEDDSSSLEWKFPGICFILFPVFLIAVLVYLQTLNQFLLDFVGLIGITLDCFWTHL